MIAAKSVKTTLLFDKGPEKREGKKIKKKRVGNHLFLLGCFWQLAEIRHNLYLNLKGIL